MVSKILTNANPGLDCVQRITCGRHMIECAFSEPSVIHTRRLEWTMVDSGEAFSGRITHHSETGRPGLTSPSGGNVATGPCRRNRDLPEGRLRPTADSMFMTGRVDGQARRSARGARVRQPRCSSVEESPQFAWHPVATLGLCQPFHQARLSASCGRPAAPS